MHFESTPLLKYWPEKDEAIEERIKALFLGRTENDAGWGTVWYEYMKRKLEFPFPAFVKVPYANPGSITYISADIKELAGPEYNTCGNIVCIGKISLDRHYGYHFMHDFSSVKAGDEIYQAVQDYFYWHFFLKRRTDEL